MNEPSGGGSTAPDGSSVRHVVQTWVNAADSELATSGV